jgi:hypothetical protein
MTELARDIAKSFAVPTKVDSKPKARAGAKAKDKDKTRGHKRATSDELAAITTYRAKPTAGARRTAANTGIPSLFVTAARVAAQCRAESFHLVATEDGHVMAFTNMNMDRVHELFDVAAASSRVALHADFPAETTVMCHNDVLAPPFKLPTTSATLPGPDDDKEDVELAAASAASITTVTNTARSYTQQQLERSASVVMLRSNSNSNGNSGRGRASLLDQFDELLLNVHSRFDYTCRIWLPSRV